MSALTAEIDTSEGDAPR